MSTSRATTVSLLALTMSVYVCLLASELQAQQTPAANGQPQAALKIDKQPLRDFLAKARQMQERGEINLNLPFEFGVKADLVPDSTLTHIAFTSITDGKGVLKQRAGDPRMRQLALDFFKALSDSHALYFMAEDAERLSFRIKTTETDIAASASFEIKTAERAAKMATGYGMMLRMGAIARRGRDEEAIYQSLKISTSDRQIIVNFSMPREIFCALLSKRLSAT